MTDIGDGTYTASYTISRHGKITTSVVLARKGGLYAEYFNNAFLSGVPTLTKVDNVMNFNWSTSLVTP